MGLIDQQVEPTETSSIELTFYPKDANGKILGTQKTVIGDALTISDAWESGNGPGAKLSRKKHSPNKKREQLPKGKEADRLAKEAALYAEQQQASQAVR